jgi:hypothetical protein
VLSLCSWRMGGVAVDAVSGETAAALGTGSNGTMMLEASWSLAAL